MKMHSYFNSRGDDLIQKYISGLRREEQVDGADVLNQMEKGEFNTLHVKPWQGKIFEVYFYKHNRIFYFVNTGSEIYLLHACRKQRNKTEQKDVKIIIDRAKELSKEIGIHIV